MEDFESEFEACLVTKFLDRLGAWGRNPDHEHIENHCYMAWLIVLEFPLSQCVFFKCYGLKDLVFCNVVVVFGPVYYRTRKSLLVSGKVLPESVYKILQDITSRLTVFGSSHGRWKESDVSDDGEDLDALLGLVT